MSLNPITREEQYYDGMINDTPVPDPVTREEHFLKNLADKIAQGGGGATSVTLAASGDNLSGDISLADLKTALSKGVVLLSFPTDGNADERVVAEYTDDSTTGLRIGVFSEDEYIIYSVVDDGNNGVTLTVVSKTNTNPYYDYTLTAAEQTAMMTALQTYLTAGVQAAGTPVHVSYSGDFSILASAVETAIEKGQQFRLNLSVGGLSNYLILSPVTGLNQGGKGFAGGAVPISGTLPGMSVSTYTMITTLTGPSVIELYGTVFTS